MFDDPKKELEQLEKQLLEDEEWFARELDSAKRMIGQMPGKPQRSSAPQPSRTATKSAPVRNYANGYGKGKPQPRKPQEEAPMPKKGITGLLILMSFELLGILGLAAYWFLVLLK